MALPCGSRLKFMKSLAGLSLLLALLLTPVNLEAAAAGSQAAGLVTSNSQDAAYIPPTAWLEWAKWVEKLHPVTDTEGHGPDIGSAEWSGALDKKLRITDAAGHGPDIGSIEWRRAVEKKLIPASDPEKTRELLSAHSTAARFEGLRDHRCLGMTALCPDRCGESGKLATFTIVKYLRYEKRGEYGDPKQEQFLVLIEDNMKHPKVSPAIRDVILALKPGDPVELDWNHDYVTQDGSKFPERPITRIVRRESP